MLKTHGLTHISLAVRDLDRTLRFYTQVFGVREYFRDEASVQVQAGPARHHCVRAHPDSAGAARHRALRLPSGQSIRYDLAIAEVQRAGGTVLRRGEFAPGYPFVYVEDPDGYEIEIWYE
jgi:catechol 2,3-dioxygenase-like lactoylglutathione lyase family enzyme